MSRCALNRWGPGTTCERPINTESSKDLQAKIALMKAERDKQDSIWTPLKEEKMEPLQNSSVKDKKSKQ